MRIILCFTILLGAFNLYSQDYYSERLFIKVKEEYKNSYSLEKDVSFLKIIRKADITSIQPVSEHPLLNHTYEVVLRNKQSLDDILLHLNQIEQIDFAEKVPIYRLFFTPNDPLYSTQWNLAKIQADKAWNLSQGCASIKIAVTDDGFLMNHEDLVNQWYINPGEINGNGIDDDGNGYIDDWRGWDAANNDNDPSATAPTNSFFTHGTHVAGIVAAQTHNSLGIASIGYNCKMIPVKIGSSPSSSLTGAFQGLDYAVNASGCDVINMSWGGGGWSATYQTLFNIAKTKGIICVAAAGNSNSSADMYPASYNHVISVAASASTDVRAWFSNYGSTIDVTAPGVDIQSCLAGATNSYGLMSGTSMASPLVAGLCGLMKCYNPMPADSIEACLKRTCDNISAQNPILKDSLGAGRINAFQALQCLTKKPKSDFLALDTFQCIGKSVRYIANSFGIPTLTYNWSFPGGSPSTSTIANPVVTYGANGLKSATLITCNSLGCDTITKANYVNIDTPRARLTNRKYTSYNSNPVIISVHFKGNPPFNVTLTDGTNNFTQTNIRSNPYFFSIVPKKDTSLISISSFSDSSCVGNRFGLDTIHRIILSGGGGAQYCESSFKFNGTNNNVVKITPQNGAAFKDLYSTNGFTWECWFNLGNRASVTGVESVVTASDAQLCEDIGFIFNMPWSGGTGFGWVVSGQTGCGAPKGVIATTMSFSPNTWYHAAGVMDYSTNTMRLYINGNQVNSGTLTIPMSQRMKNSVAVTIGNQDVNYNPYHTFTPFSGKVDEVRFWNTVRTASEIQANYKACLAANASNLVAYFKADEGTGNNTVSVVNGNFVGTLQNSASWDTQVDSVKNCTICDNITDCDTTNLNTGKVLHLDFNGNTQDKSGNSNHATNFGATPAAGKAGVANTAYRFDGVNDYMQVSHATSLSPSSVTMTAIIKPRSFNADPCMGNEILTKGYDLPGGSGRYCMRYSPLVGNCTAFGDTILNNFYPVFKGFSGCATSVINDTPKVKTNRWYCLVMSYGNDTIKTYIDGILRHSCYFAGPLGSNTFDLFIGKHNHPAGTFPYWLSADIDEIRIYNRVLVPSEVKGYCGTCNVTPPSDCDTTNLNTGKVLHLDFNGNTQDKSGNSNHATNFGATPVAGKAGVANTAYRFNGSSNYMRVSHAASLNLQNVTICALIKPRAFYNGPCLNNAIIEKGHDNTTSGKYSVRYAPVPNFCISTDDTTKGNFFPIFKGYNGCTSSVIDNNPKILTNNWYCVVSTYDGDSIRMYVNGIRRYACQLNGPLGSNTEDIFLGKHNHPSGNFPYWLNADVDDIRVYNRVLVPSEVKGYCGTCNVTPPSDCDTTNLNTGKVLHLDFNGNTQDKSGNSNHATNFGATSVAGKSGAANTAYKFNGTSDYMEIPHSSSLNPNSAITMTAIVKVDGYSPLSYNASSIMSKALDGSSGFYTLRLTDDIDISVVDTNTSVFYGQFVNDNFAPIFSSVIDQPVYIQKNNWYCVVFTFDGDSCRMYINGYRKYAYKSGTNQLISTSGSLRIGSGLNANPFQYYFNGVLDDIRIYNRVLAPSEVKGYCGTCNVTPPLTDCDTSGLVLCMSMDGTSNDSSKYNNHGTKIGGVSNANDRNGKSNSAFSFNGTNAYIEVPSATSIQLTNELTISLWINQTSTSTQGYRLVDKITATTGDGYLFDTYGHPTNTTWRGRTTRFVNKEVNWHSNNKPYNLNSWVHVAVTHKNGLVSYYTNGVLDTSYSHSVTALNINTLPLRIGAGNPLNFYFNGAMDELKIYRRALTATEVFNLYTKPFSCSCNSTQPPPCDTSRRFTYTQCLNDSIHVIARAGSKYQWSPISGLSNDTIRNPKVFVSNNQRYLVSYTSLKNCQLIDTIDVEVKTAAIYPKLDDQIICIGDSVQMTIPIYGTNIVWSPNAALSSTSSKNPYFFPNSTTTYYLEFRDTFGCLQRDTFVVNTKVCCPARARFTIPKDLLCFGETLPITNTSKGPITSYSWNFSSAIPNTFAGANPPILTFPSGGSYTLRLIVTNGVCFDTMTKTVSIIQINPNAGKDTNNCLGAFTTQLGESPISDWTYKWTPTQYLNDAAIANPICSIVNDSINYILEIMDRNSGCKAFDTVVVYTNRKIDSTAQNLRICFGDSVLFNGIYRKTTNNYFYTIKKADGICDSFINLLRLNVLQKQIINYTDTSACEVYFDSKGRKHTISFSQYDTIKSKTILNCDSIIYFRNVKIYNKVYRNRTPVIGCAPFRYNGKTYLVSKMKADSIRIRNIYLNDCDTIEYINITVHPKPTAVINPSIPNPVLYKQTVTLSASGGQTYFWLQTGSNVPDIYYKINDIGPKLFTVRVTDENDCWDTVSYLVQGKLPEACYYGFPNVFSPNEDSLNDEYIPNMDECTEVIIFAIYDRWGEKVFETNQLKGWNGYFKGRPAPMGVYVYFARLKTPWGIKERQGSFTLMR